MYAKVVLSAIAIIGMSGCVTQQELNAPAKKEVAQKVQEVEDATVVESISEVSPLGKDSIVHESGSKKRARKLKPEPFSLKSNQKDPELLGPQTTMDRPLSRLKDNNDSESM